MWTIEVEPKQIYVDENKPRVSVVQIYPVNFEPEIGLTFRVAGCTGFKQLIFEDVEKLVETTKEDGSTVLEHVTERVSREVIHSGNELSSDLVKIEGEEYTNWTGGDLPYLENIILSSCGYKKA